MIPLVKRTWPFEGYSNPPSFNDGMEEAWKDVVNYEKADKCSDKPPEMQRVAWESTSTQYSSTHHHKKDKDEQKPAISDELDREIKRVTHRNCEGGSYFGECSDNEG